MANEIMFPIKETSYFDKIVKGLVSNLKELLIDIRMISIGVLNNSDLDLSHGFIIIQDHSNDNVCWSNFSYFEPEVRDESEADLPIMSGVIYRGEKNRKFSVLVTYILAKILEARVIYDDAYLVQRKEVYPVEELKPFVEQYIKELYPVDK